MLKTSTLNNSPRGKKTDSGTWIMGVIGVPIGIRDYQGRDIGDSMTEQTMALVYAQVPLKDNQAIFEILRLSATSRLHFLLRTLPP